MDKVNAGIKATKHAEVIHISKWGEISAGASSVFIRQQIMAALFGYYAWIIQRWTEQVKIAQAIDFPFPQVTSGKNTTVPLDSGGYK